MKSLTDAVAEPSLVYCRKDKLSGEILCDRHCTTVKSQFPNSLKKGIKLVEGVIQAQSKKVKTIIS